MIHWDSIPPNNASKCCSLKAQILRASKSVLYWASFCLKSIVDITQYPAIIYTTSTKQESIIMTRQEFISQANVIRQIPNIAERKQTAEIFTNTKLNDNSSFDKLIFLKACGL